MGNVKVPRSQIVYHDDMRSLLAILKEYGVDLENENTSGLDLEDELTVYKLKAYVLYEKYVENDHGELQINISSRARHELAEKMKKEDFLTDIAVDELYLFSIYTLVIDEIHGLLNHSHLR